MKTYTLLTACSLTLALAFSSCGDTNTEETTVTDTTTMMTPVPDAAPETPRPDTNPIPPVDPAMDTAAGDNTMTPR